LNEQDDKHFSIGAMSALEIAGYAHYLPMGKRTTVLFSPKGERLPLWFTKLDWDVYVRYHTTECFSPDLGIDAFFARGF
jgi:hypothetical protein